MSAAIQPTQVIAFSAPEIKGSDVGLVVRTLRGAVNLCFSRSLWADFEVLILNHIDSRPAVVPKRKRVHLPHRSKPETWIKYHQLHAEYLRQPGQRVRRFCAQRGMMNTGSVYRAFKWIREGLAPYDAKGNPVSQPVLKPNGKLL